MDGNTPPKSAEWVCRSHPRCPCLGQESTGQEQGVFAKDCRLQTHMRQPDPACVSTAKALLRKGIKVLRNMLLSSVESVPVKSNAGHAIDKHTIPISPSLTVASRRALVVHGIGNIAATKPPAMTAAVAIASRKVSGAMTFGLEPRNVADIAKNIKITPANSATASPVSTP